MSEADRRLLLIAHAFPPAGGAGVQRPAKFARYLCEMGWSVTVLAAEPSGAAPRDESLLAEIPDAVSVLRIPFERRARPAPARWGVPGLDRLRHEFWLARRGPDVEWAWCRQVLRAASGGRLGANPDVIVATGDPFSSFVLAGRLSRKSGAPYVLDFRDPWCHGGGARGSSGIARELRWERDAVGGAARCVFATEGMRGLYAGVYPSEAAKFEAIENGVDLEEKARAADVEVNRREFEIVYTGSLSGLKDPGAFLDALVLARERSTEFRKAARFIHAGQDRLGETGEPLEVQLRSRGLEECCRRLGYVAHDRAVRLQRAAGALVLILARGEYIVCGKSYEYLASGRPVLAMVPPEGEAARILRRSGSTVIAAPDGPEDTASKLLALFDRWRTGEGVCTGTSMVPREYTRRYQAEQMARVLEAAVTGHRAQT